MIDETKCFYYSGVTCNPYEHECTLYNTICETRNCDYKSKNPLKRIRYYIKLWKAKLEHNLINKDRIYQIEFIYKDKVLATRLYHEYNQEYYHRCELIAIKPFCKDYYSSYDTIVGKEVYYNNERYLITKLLKETQSNKVKAFLIKLK